MFVPGKPFQPSLMFASKAESYPSGAREKELHLALHTNIRLDWKNVPETNTRLLQLGR